MSEIQKITKDKLDWNVQKLERLQTWLSQLLKETFNIWKEVPLGLLRASVLNLVQWV